MTPGLNVIKQMFVPGKPSLMFANKTGAYPIEAPSSCPALGQAPGLTLQALAYTGKACQGQSLAYFIHS